MNRKILLSMNAENFFVPLWIKAYLDADYEIDIVSRYDIRKNRFYDRIMEIVEERGKEKLGVRCCQTNIPRGIIADYLRLSIEMPTLIHSEKYDALHVHGLNIRGIGAALSRIDNLILTPYGSDMFDKNAWGRLFPRAFPDILIRKLLLKSTLILPTSKYMEIYISWRFGIDSSKIFTKSWGIDLDQWSKKCINTNLTTSGEFDDDAITFLSYRSAKPIYNIHILPKIHSLLEKNGINANFIYCMNSKENNPYVRSIVTDIKNRGLWGKSHFFFEALQGNEIRCLLDKSDYFFSIPKWDQLSSTLLEGLYRKVVPIILPLPAYRELLEQGCQCIIADPTPEKLANAIIDGVRNGIHSNNQVLSKNETVVTQYHDRSKNLPEIMNRITNTLLA